MGWLQQIAGTGYPVCILVTVYKELTTVLIVKYVSIIHGTARISGWYPLVGQKHFSERLDKNKKNVLTEAAEYQLAERTL